MTLKQQYTELIQKCEEKTFILFDKVVSYSKSNRIYTFYNLSKVKELYNNLHTNPEKFFLNHIQSYEIVGDYEYVNIKMMNYRPKNYTKFSNINFYNIVNITGTDLKYLQEFYNNLEDDFKISDVKVYLYYKINNDVVKIDLKYLNTLFFFKEDVAENKMELIKNKIKLHQDYDMVKCDSCNTMIPRDVAIKSTYKIPTGTWKGDLITNHFCSSKCYNNYK